MFSLIHMLIRLSPGCTPAHFALMSAEHACSIDNFCAVAAVAEKERTTPIIRTILNIVQPFIAVTHSEYFEPLTTNQIERREYARHVLNLISRTEVQQLHLADIQPRPRLSANGT